MCIRDRQNITSDYQLDPTHTPGKGVTVGLDAKTYDTMLDSYDKQISSTGRVASATLQATAIPLTFGLSTALPALIASGAIEGFGAGYVDAVLDDPEIKAAYGEMTPEVMLRSGLSGLLGSVAPAVPGALAVGGKAFLRQALANKASKEALKSLLKNTKGLQGGLQSVSAKFTQTDITGAVSSGLKGTKKFLTDIFSEKAGSAKQFATDIFTNPEMVDKGFDVAGKKVAGVANKIIGVPSSIIKVLDNLDVAQKLSLIHI